MDHLFPREQIFAYFSGLCPKMSKNAIENNDLFGLHEFSCHHPSLGDPATNRDIPGRNVGPLRTSVECSS
jgi:hypothetical protein